MSALVRPDLDPLAAFTLDALVVGAARLRPGRAALADDTGATRDAAALERDVGAMAGRMALYGLAPGETVLVVGGARAATVVATLAGLRAGLHVALASAAHGVEAIGAAARRVEAAVIVAERDHGGLSPLARALEAARACPDVRLVGGLGGALDGAAALDAGDTAPLPACQACGRVVTFAGATPVAHDQATLVAAALDLISTARIGAERPLLSCLAPVSFAGLVAGPVAALVSRAALRLTGPFEAEAFRAALDACAPAHLVAPDALGEALRDAGLLDPARLAGLILRVRGAPPPLGAGLPVTDLHALGERAAIPVPRGADDAPGRLGAAPHEIVLGDAHILAVEAREGPRGREWRGRAVSSGGQWSPL